jgi:tetratricopeptide (TPR) repeat protein
VTGRTPLLAVLCLVALALPAAIAPRIAHADDTATKSAKRHFERGEKLFALGQFSDALEAYKAAYRAKPIPEFLFNIGQCYRNLVDYEAAIFSYKKYLQLEPDAANRDQVEKLIDDLEAKQQEVQAEHDRDRDRDREQDRDSTTTTAEPATPRRSHADAPFYTKWWFWTGVVLVGAAGGIGGYEALHNGPPTTDLGPPLNFRH